jgi:hypothetical protein
MISGLAFRAKSTNFGSVPVWSELKTIDLAGVAPPVCQGWHIIVGDSNAVTVMSLLLKTVDGSGIRAGCIRRRRRDAVPASTLLIGCRAISVWLLAQALKARCCR